MKQHSAILPKKTPQRGMTILELTVIIVVLISLISIIFIGSRAWKAGSDRANCIINISHVQKGVRAYSNIYGYSPGAPAPELLDQIVGFGRFVNQTPRCPRQGEYSFGEEYGVNFIPPIGVLYMTCSLSTSDEHEPEGYSEW